MVNILLTGSTGLIGSKIKELLMKDTNNILYLPIRNCCFKNTKNLVYFNYDLFYPIS